MRRTVRPVTLSLGAVLVSVACAACGSGEPAADATVPSTVANVGRLADTPLIGAGAPQPPERPAAGERSPDTTDESTDASATDEPRAPFGELVDGNRILVIGDSLLASLAPRYGGELCPALVDQGWEVEINAETGRFVDFAADVLDERLDDGFDAAVILLGNNYGGDEDAYAKALGDALDELEPRPTLVLTVTEFRRGQTEVNDTIADVVRTRDWVRVLDWAAVTDEDRFTAVTLPVSSGQQPAAIAETDATSSTADESGSSDGRSTGTLAVDDLLDLDPSYLVSNDGVHLSTRGRELMAVLIADEFGKAPERAGGECLPSDFTDDSAGRTIQPIPGDGSGTSSFTTTTRSRAGNDSDTGNGSGNGGRSPTTVAVTSPPRTTPPRTSPPVTTPRTTPAPTNPPHTNPPATNPPATNPPVTILPPVTLPS